ncbi:MAG: hypothetical protein ACTSQH_04230 [Candidatus Hodarchaeales archaeon]
MREKTITAKQIKKKYLRKLSIELIKRGTSNDKIKTMLDEVSFSVDDYISEFKPKDLEEFINKFGSSEDFCDNNSIIQSKVASIGQLFLITRMLSSILVVPILSIVSLFTISLFPNASDFTKLLQIWSSIGIKGANSGYGIIGAIFGLNVFVWMMYQYFKDKFSPYDIRETVKGAILGLYWYLVIFCLYLILDSYISHYLVIQDMWNQNMKLLILEGIFRWIALESVLLITAIFYTYKYKKQYHKIDNVKQKNYLIDKIGMIVIVFILTGFISAGPGMGILIIAIGIGVLFLTKFTSKTWLLGLLAILLQLGALVTKIIDSFPFPQYFRTWIFFGIQTNESDDYLIFVAILALFLAIAWSLICIKHLKKNKLKLLPRFRIPKGKTALISVFLVSLTLIAVLGTQPQKVRYASDVDIYQESTYFEIDQSYLFQRKGKLSISIYTYMEETSYTHYSNGTIIESTHHLEGNWYLTWTQTGEVFRTFRIEGNFDNYSTPSYSIDDHNVSIKYISLNINGSGVLKYHITLYSESLTKIHPYMQMQFSAIVPWLPNWYDIVIFVCVVFFIFFKWDEKALQLSSNLKKGDD